MVPPLLKSATAFAFSAALILKMPDVQAQMLKRKDVYSHQDTLRGSVTPERAWWDVLHYNIEVTPDYTTKSIQGKTSIQYKVVQDEHTAYMQVDLQKPLTIDEIYYNNKRYIEYPLRPVKNEGNVWLIPLPKTPRNSVQTISFVYHGTPREARMPPWDGGWIWTKDKQGKPWMSVACQGLGASVWYPCKDYQGDEPDNGAIMTITVPQGMVAVGNGRLEFQKNYPSLEYKIDSILPKNNNNQQPISDYTWQVKSPINSYNIIPYIGNYTSWADTLMGEKGKLDLSFWVLKEDLDKAKKQFEQVKPMLRAFEYWFGPYPFYEDGYKLVQAPHLGMEHQSAVAYGNEFRNGYLGEDLSGSGWGMKWDYIIVHESGHEWFGNSITTKDIADMWVHEGFTDYSETLFTEYYYGKQAANEYVQGLRKKIKNDSPIIGKYGINKEGSGDMYYKGANMIHTIRQIIDNDEKFRQILRGLNRTFYHQTITTGQIESYINQQSGKDFSKVFDQYLRNTNIPTLEISTIQGKTRYRWMNTIDGFNMPVKLTDGTWLYPTNQWKALNKPGTITVDPNFYVYTRKV
ncbi:MAG: M1 family metallopeptidase [Candidatus Dadabacteria bacterium]